MLGRYRSPDREWCVEVWEAIGAWQEYRVLRHGALVLRTASLERVGEYLRAHGRVDIGDLVED